jgi:hypothetical protein
MHVNVSYKFKQHNFVSAVGFELLTAVVIKSSLLWVITPCSPLEFNRLFMPISCLAYSTTLKMEATCSSKT